MLSYRQQERAVGEVDSEGRCAVEAAQDEQVKRHSRRRRHRVVARCQAHARHLWASQFENLQPWIRGRRCLPGTCLGALALANDNLMQQQQPVLLKQHDSRFALLKVMCK